MIVRKSQDKKKISLSKEDILHLAKLSRLQLTDKEIEKYKKQLEETIDFIKNLEELDTSKVQPTNSVVDLKNVTYQDGVQNKRELTQREALANTKKSKEGKFVVDRIM